MSRKCAIRAFLAMTIAVLPLSAARAQPQGGLESRNLSRSAVGATDSFKPVPTIVSPSNISAARANTNVPGSPASGAANNLGNNLFNTPPSPVLPANPSAIQLSDAGFAAFKKGDKVLAIKYFNQSLKMAEDANDARQIFVCLDFLDTVLDDKVQLATNYNRMVALAEKTPALSSLLCKLYVRHSGDAYLRDDIPAAEALLQKARKLAYRQDETLAMQGDIEYMHVAIDGLIKMGKYDQALLECKRALDECQSHKLHPICFARILRVKGEVYLAQEKFSEAEKCFQEALLKLEAGRSTNSSLYGSILFYRSILHVKMEDYEVAKAEYDRAQAILDKVPNTGNIDLSFRGTLSPEPLVRFGRRYDGRREAEIIYNFRKNKFPLDSSIVAESELTFAWTLAASGERENALMLADQAIYVLNSKLSAEDNRNGRVQWMMAEIENLCGRKKAAKEYYEKSGAIMKAKFGGTSPLYQDCLTKIAGLNKDVPYQIAGLPLMQSGARWVPPTPLGLVKQNTNPEVLFTNLANPAAASTIARGFNNSKIGDKWALLVGISKFQEKQLNLRFPSKDASDLYHVLIDKLNFAPDHVALLTNQYATRENILSMLGDKWLPRVAAPEDLVLIFLSTHGSPSELDIGGINYLLAHNTDPRSLYATGLPLQDLVNMIKKRVHAKRVVLVLDACHSGSAQVESKGMAVNRAADAQIIAQGTGQMVICSSSPTELSWESKEYSNGVFTRHLIDCLSKSGGMQPFSSIFQTLAEDTRNEVQRDRGVLQTPILRSAWSGDDLYIGAKASNPKPGLGIRILQTDFDMSGGGESTTSDLSGKTPGKVAGKNAVKSYGKATVKTIRRTH